MKKLLTLSGLAAGLMYFFDSQQGNARRKGLVGRAGGMFRGGLQRGERAGRAVASQAFGVTQKVTHMREGEKDYDDITLTRKVESEIFRDADAPKGQVDVNVIDGVVYLRGEVEEDMIKDLERATRKVAGVKDVENLLHTPGTPAPPTPEGETQS
jgi:osmotically-inducible protein OsmY